MIFLYNKYVKQFVIYLFDLDGTLVDTKPGITKSIKATLEELQLKNIAKEAIDCDFNCFIGPPLVWSFSHYCNLNQEEATSAMTCYRKYYKASGIYDCKVYDGLLQTLRTLQKRGATLLVATSKPTVFARKILEHLELSQYFNAISGSDINEAHCDKEHLIKTALSLANISAKNSDILMVGDRKFDIQGAISCGIEQAGALWGFGTKDELETAGATYLIESPLMLL